MAKCDFSKFGCRVMEGKFISDRAGYLPDPADMEVAFMLGNDSHRELGVFEELGVRIDNVTGVDRTSATDFFRTTPQRFDMISLSYQGEVPPDFENTIRYISGRQLLKEKSVLVTNFCGADLECETRKPHHIRLKPRGFLGKGNWMLNMEGFKGLTTEDVESVIRSYISAKEVGHGYRDIRGLVSTLLLKSKELFGMNPVYEGNNRMGDLKKDIKSVYYTLSLGLGDEVDETTEMEIKVRKIPKVADLDDVHRSTVGSILHRLYLEDHLKDYLEKNGISPEKAKMMAKRISVLPVMHGRSPYFLCDSKSYSVKDEGGGSCLDLYFLNQLTDVLYGYGAFSENIYGNLRGLEETFPQGLDNVLKDCNVIEKHVGKARKAWRSRRHVLDLSPRPEPPVKPYKSEKPKVGTASKKPVLNKEHYMFEMLNSPNPDGAYFKRLPNGTKEILQVFIDKEIQSMGYFSEEDKSELAIEMGKSKWGKTAVKYNQQGRGLYVSDISRFLSGLKQYCNHYRKVPDRYEIRKLCEDSLSGIPFKPAG